MKKGMSGARFIAETLKGYEVSHVFLVMLILKKTLVELEDVGIRRIVAHSEKAAAYMADGYARISGKPGVCFAQSVGAANMAAGLQDPYLAHTPVIALTGRKEPELQYRNAYQEIIHGPMFEPVTKYNVNVDKVEQLPHLLCQAFREATTGSTRPVHLDLLGYTAELIDEANIDVRPVVEEPYTRYPAFRPEPAQAILKAAALKLKKASRPVIVVGGGAYDSSAGPEIVRLAEMLSIPVATSNDGKGIITDNHPLCAGVVGTYSCRCANQVVSQADLVFYIGCGTGDMATHNWTVPGPETTIIQLDINPAELGRSYRNTLGLLGDAKATLTPLTELLKGSVKKSSWAKKAQKFIKDWKASIEPLRNSNDIPIRPERLCKEISEILPPNAVLVADTGYSTLWSSTMLHLTHPEQKYLRAAGSLGWSFPASLGVKCGAPERPVVCFTGDGAFWYHLSELETAKRRGIHTVTVVNNNSGFGQCVVGVDAAYGKARGKKRSEVYGFETIDFAKIAQDLGCMGIRVESPDGIAPALEQALAADTPVVVDVATDINCRPPALWLPTEK